MTGPFTAMPLKTRGRTGILMFTLQILMPASEFNVDPREK